MFKTYKPYLACDAWVVIHSPLSNPCSFSFGHLLQNFQQTAWSLSAKYLGTMSYLNPPPVIFSGMKKCAEVLPEFE